MRFIAFAFFVLLNSQFAFSQTDVPIMVSGMAFPSRPVDQFVKNNGMFLTVVASSRIQKELGLTEKQAKQIGALQKQRLEKISKIYRAMDRQRLNDAELIRIGDEVSSIHGEYEEMAARELAPKQKQRLVQIIIWEDIWRYGFANLLLATKFGRELGVTPNQRDELKAVAKELISELDKFNDWCLETIEDELIKELSKKQREKLKELIGHREKAKSWGSVSATFQILRLTKSWKSKEKKNVLGTRIQDHLRPSANRIERVDASRNTELQFVVFLRRSEVAKELDLTPEQESQLQKAEKEFRSDYRKLISDNKKLRKTDLSAFRSIIKKAETEYSDFVLSKILVSHQATILKRLYYSSDIRLHGLLHCLSDSTEMSLGSQLELSDLERRKLTDKSVEIVKTIVKKQKELQKKSVFEFVKKLDDEQARKVKELIGEVPKQQPFTSLDSISIQLKYATGQCRPRR